MNGLTEAGFDVAGKAATPDELRRRVELTRPDVAITDIKMPPTHRRGLVAAQEVRGSHPQCGGAGALSLPVMRLLQQHPGGVGYLFKERVSNAAVLATGSGASTRRVPARPHHRRRLIKRPRPGGPLAELTKCEHQVLGLMAEGRSNQGICDRLFLSLNTVEAHVKHSAAGALRSWQLRGYHVRAYE